MAACWRGEGRSTPLCSPAISRARSRLGARQMVELTVEMVQTSCGYGVPTYDYVGERPSLDNWANAKGGEAGLQAYRREKNETSIDDLPTGLVEPEIAVSAAAD